MVIGIFIALLSGAMSAGMPYLIKIIFPPHSLQYSFQGPISTKNSMSFSITINNVGQKPEQSIEVWLPLLLMEMPELSSGIFSKPKVEIKTSIPASITRKKDDEMEWIVKFNRLRPEEKMTISVFMTGAGATSSINAIDLDNLRIVSKETIAQFEGDELDKKLKLNIYQFTTWLLVFLFLFVLAYGFYYEKLAPKEKKIRVLRDQLNKLEDHTVNEKGI